MEKHTEIKEDSSLFQQGALIAGRYEVVSPLGKGGMGMVLRVIDRALDNEPSALKILYPHHVEDKVIFARFRNEVLVARALAHPNIVRLYDFGSAGKGYYYISMEYVQGYSLKDRIYSPKLEELSFPEICRILYEIGSGLAYAHKKGVIHRDMKPDNILLTPGGDVRISDFGLARTVAADKGFTQTGETVGTPCYMAPEQISGSTVDGRADIYSLGILAFEMATGSRPFEDESWFALAKMHMTKPMPAFAKDFSLPNWFEELVHQSSAKNPDDRIQSADEWCQEIAKHVNPSGNKLGKISPAVFSTSFAQTLSSQRKRKQLRSKFLGFTFPIIIGLVVCAFCLLGIRGIPPLQRAALSGIATIERATSLKLSGLKKLSGLSVSVTGETLAAAIETKDLTKALLLIAAGVDLTAKDSAGTPILFKALASNWNEFVIGAINSPGITSLKDSDGKSLFFRAVELGNTELIQPLVGGGANINERDSLGRTALMVAAGAGDFIAVQELIALGALTSLSDATQDALPTTIYAVKGGNPQVLSAIISAGGTNAANSTDAKKLTPLIYAAESGNEELIKILLAAKADPEKRTLTGKTVRDFASGKIRQNYFSENSAKQTTGASSVLSAKQTKLRMIDEPRVDWLLGRSPKLRSLQVTIRNVGDEKAIGVKVEAVLPGGQIIPVSGPSELNSNEIVTYQPKLANPFPVPNTGDIEIQISCENCRK